MPEISFVLKSFVIAVVLTVVLQVKVGKSSLETEAYTWLQTSSVPLYLQNVASGAVLAIKNTAKIGTDFVAKTFGHDANSQRAGRLSLDLKRNPRVEEEATRHHSND